MKLVRQARLLFVEGKSEKVYEVDLCEVGPNKLVVNFRYGKKGAALKDGSKTVAPVGLDLLLAHHAVIAHRLLPGLPQVRSLRQESFTRILSPWNVNRSQPSTSTRRPSLARGLIALSRGDGACRDSQRRSSSRQGDSISP